MAIRVNDQFVKSFIDKEELSAIQNDVCTAHKLVTQKNGAGSDFLGWADLPVNYDKEEFARIKVAAEKIKKSCDVFVVIGIGGSYLGARSAIEFVKSPFYNNMKKDTPDIYFAGVNISASTAQEILDLCEGKDVCLNVISKSGTTTEPALAFRIFREMIEKKYGEKEAAERIFVTTDKARGKLKALATEKGYETFVVPDDIGGRYSVLTAVGLLPIAVSGCDIDAMMRGAQAAKTDFSDCDIAKNECYKYAALRSLLYRKGKKIEILTAYEDCMRMMSEWWKQLYGESEGKDKKGIFPASTIFSTDLHSMGQYIQDGERTLFETVVDIKTSNHTVIIPNDERNLDGQNYLAGRTMHEVNQIALSATVLAHVDGGVPNIILELDSRSEFDYGYMVYFFELACAISGYMLGVNPFNQPGVEDYKKNMYALLGREGEEFDVIRNALNQRLQK